MRFLVALLLISNLCFASTCEQLLGGDSTGALISYLSQLVESRMLGDDELVRLISTQNELTNPISDERAAIDSAASIQKDGIEKIIALRDIDQTEVRRWAEEVMKNRSRTRANRDEARHDTIAQGQKIIFNRVEPGKFIFGEFEKKRPVRIEHSFELMAHPFTQWQWLMIMGKNPSKFEYQFDNPVERVSFLDITKDLIPKLNLLSKNDDPRLYVLIPDHRKGDRYRLPRETEWEFVATNRGTAEDFPFDGPIEEYAWIRENSHKGGFGSTQPVGILKPIIVDGHEFYDMIGNVAEWTQGTPGRDWKPTRGAGWPNEAPSNRARARFESAPNRKAENLGFRLVRERAK